MHCCSDVTPYSSELHLSWHHVHVTSSSVENHKPAFLFKWRLLVPLCYVTTLSFAQVMQSIVTVIQQYSCG
jgi:hypothetical protein